MAYLMKLALKCYADGCTKPATHQLFTYRNESTGKYCERHATERLKAVQETEKKVFAQK